MDGRDLERLAGAARAALARNDPDEAAHLAERVLAVRSRHAGALSVLGTARILRGRTDEGLASLRTAARVARRDPLIHCDLAAALMGVGDFDGSIAAYDAALRLDRGHRPALIGKAGVLERRGEDAAALRLLDRAAKAGGDPEPPRATVIRATILDRGDADARAEAHRLAEAVVDRPNVPGPHRRALGFLLGRAADRNGDVDAAFARLSAANAIGRPPVERDAIADRFAAIRRAFPAAPHPDRPTATIPTRGPLFIVGLPRSGSTLLESMLDAHPLIHGAGEVPHIGTVLGRVTDIAGVPYPGGWARLTAADLDRLAASYLDRLRTGAGDPDAQLIVDKALGNVRHLGAIDRLLPEAVFVHVSRDRVDAGLSAWMQDLIPTLYPWSCDLADCGWYVRQTELQLAHWRERLGDRILSVRYEELVADPERELRRVLEHAGLAFDPACLAGHTRRRDVATASYAQVAEPVHRRAVGRADRYRDHLGPLIDALGPATPA